MKLNKVKKLDKFILHLTYLYNNYQYLVNSNGLIFISSDASTQGWLLLEHKGWWFPPIRTISQLLGVLGMLDLEIG